MEGKPFSLFLQDENDNVTALDDLLHCSERHVEPEWNFKSDFLGPRDSRFDLVTDDKGDSISESLEDVSYLNDVYPKKENLEAKSSCTGSFTFENLDNVPKPLASDLPCVNESSSASKSDKSIRCGSEELSDLSTGASRCEGTEEELVDYTSESDGSLPYRDGDLEEKLRNMQQYFASHCDADKQLHMVGYEVRKEVQKPPTTAGIGLKDLKAVFHLERPKAEKKLRLKRTTFSNLSRHYGISKWPFRTIRDAMNRMQANNRLLLNRGVSEERQRKLTEQQRLLSGVIKLIYTDPRESRDSNTLAVLLRIVAAREGRSKFSEL